MRYIVLISLVTGLSALWPQVAGAMDCKGGVWRKIEASIGVRSDLEKAVTTLREQGIGFDSSNLMDESYEPRVKDYLSLGIEPGCSLIIGDWLPLQENEIKCFPFTTATSEFTAIDFDAAGKLIGLRCSGAMVKMSCEDARKLVDAETRRPAGITQQGESPFGLPVQPRAGCAALQGLN